MNMRGYEQSFTAENIEEKTFIGIKHIVRWKERENKLPRWRQEVVFGKEVLERPKVIVQTKIWSRYFEITIKLLVWEIQIVRGNLRCYLGFSLNS